MAVRTPLEFQRTREVEEAGNDGVEPVHLADNVSCHFRGERVRRLQAAHERLGGASNHGQGVANLVRQAGRKLAQGRQPLRAAGVFLRLLQAPVGARQLLGQQPVTLQTAGGSR